MQKQQNDITNQNANETDYAGYSKRRAKLVKQSTQFTNPCWEVMCSFELSDKTATYDVHCYQ